MSETASTPAESETLIDGRSLDVYASAIQSSFPALRDVRPVSLLGEGWDSVVVETAGAVVFRFPKREAVAASLGNEARLLPFLRSRLTPDVPVPSYEGAPAPDFPWGFLGYDKVPGQTLRAGAINERNIDRLALAIGRFLAELHQFPEERARAFGLPGLREWKPSYVALRDAVLPVLRRELRLNAYNRVRRWWREFLDDEAAWSFTPALVHGDLADEHILVDEEARELLGVIDWGDAAVGDPAIDFVGLMRAYGADFTWRVVEVYSRSGVEVDAGLLRRVRLLSAVVPFYAVQFAAEVKKANPEAAGPSMAEAVAELQAGPILTQP